MYCTWCGAPVRINGNRWECGYCGDSGELGNISQVPKYQKPKQITSYSTFGIIWSCLVAGALIIAVVVSICC